MPALSIQAVLVLGISPRLPFDDNYRTFFELVGARIAALLQSEVHQTGSRGSRPEVQQSGRGESFWDDDRRT